jgi:phosphoglycolate phosphatase-like HAD superfamily hydrolase
MVSPVIKYKIPRSAIQSQITLASLIFWDFDGVIKDSVGVKKDAYAKLFSGYDRKVVRLIIEHNKINGGLSRFKKIPLYLTWACESVTESLIEDFCNRYSILVKQAVIDAPWVPGLLNYLKKNYLRQKFIIVTATPQNEIVDILYTLGISHYFYEVHGSPKEKCNVISDVLKRFKCNNLNALMIGDSKEDYLAAHKNMVPFILRANSFNQEFLTNFDGPIIVDLDYE